METTELKTGKEANDAARAIVKHVEEITGKSLRWEDCAKIIAVVQLAINSSAPAPEGDTARLDWLAWLIENYPHADVFHNADEDEEDEHGMRPIGWTISTDGCQGVDRITRPTFREVIDAAMSPDTPE